MSVTAQFEDLTNEKACAEEESRRLEEEQKQLEIRARLLLEKIIQQLRSQNAEKKQAIGKLQLKIRSLGAQLNDLSGSGVASPPAKEKGVEAAGDMPDAGENVMIFAVEGEIETLEPIQERKKRK